MGTGVCQELSRRVGGQVQRLGTEGNAFLYGPSVCSIDAGALPFPPLLWVISGSDEGWDRGWGRGAVYCALTV